MPIRFASDAKAALAGAMSELAGYSDLETMFMALYVCTRARRMDPAAVQFDLIEFFAGCGIITELGIHESRVERTMMVVVGYCGAVWCVVV